MLLFSIIFYLFILFASIITIILYKKDNINVVLPMIFLLVISLYVLPLPLHCYTSNNSTLVDGDISYLIYNFIDFIPFAIIFSSLFVIVFVATYLISIRIIKPSQHNIKPFKTNYFFWFMYAVLWVVSLSMLMILANESGGFLQFILSGYSVTEKFIGQQYLAISFEWITVLIVLLFTLSCEKEHSKLRLLSWGLIIVAGLSFAVMGRRSMLIFFGISILFVYHYRIKHIKPVYYVLIIFFGFFMLNIVGLIRGDEYSNISNMVDIVSDKTSRYSDDGTFSNNLFYTITTGNFAVPFETFPQIIKGFGEQYSPGFGLYSFQSLSLVIPNVIWADRPLPLSNWYMQVFYGNTPLNQGRQFFFLTSSYMDFGVFGAPIFGILYGVFFGWMSVNFDRFVNNSILLVVMALFVGSMLNFVANDTAGFLVAFIKSNLAVLMLLLLSTKFVFGTRNIKSEREK